jgi:hypothetical protein
MAVDEVNELLGAVLPLGDDWDTIGGLVLAIAGHIPKEGESIEVDGYRLVAENVESQRIGAVSMQAIEGPPLHLEEEDEGEGEGGEVGGALSGDSIASERTALEADAGAGDADVGIAAGSAEETSARSLGSESR